MNKLSVSKLDEKGFFGKLFYFVVEFPLSLLRDLTIPAVEVERWNRRFFILMPFTTVFFFLTITESKS